MLRHETASDLHELRDPIERSRVVRVRVEGPRGYAQGSPLPHVLVLPGFKGFMHWGFFPELSHRIAQAGMVAVSLNTSGCGVGPDLETFTELEAFERDTPSRQLEDLDRVREYVLGRLPAVDREHLGLFGHSRGGAIVLLHAGRHRDYSAIATWAAVDALDRYDDETRALWRTQGHLPVVHTRTGQILRMGVAALEDLEENADDLDVLLACGGLRAPTLLVQGEADEAVDPASVHRIAAAMPAGVGHVLTVEGAGHTFGADHPLTHAGPELDHVLTETVDHLRTNLAG